MNSVASSLIVLLRLLCRESRQRNSTCPFSRLMSLPFRIEQSADFLAAPDRGQLASYLGLDDLLIKPGLLQRPRVEKLQR
jgi:hypothetical protein